MKISIHFIAYSSILLIVIACEQAEYVSNEFDELRILDEYVITPVDSFGEEIGDSLKLLGDIIDLCNHPEGSILLLDAACCRVHVADSCPYFISRPGEGPGELLYPLSICILNDGRMLVSDEMKHAVLSFSQSGEYLADYFTSDFYTPYAMYPVDSNSIVYSQVNLDFIHEDPIYQFVVARYDELTGSSTVYEQMSWEWTSADFYRDISNLDFVASPEGIVYVAEDVTMYSVTVYSPDGYEQYVITRHDIDRILKSDAEIEREITEFEEWAQQDQAYMGGYEPSQYHTLISLVGIDDDRNLWIERLTPDTNQYCDVWSPTGEMLYSVKLHRSEDDLYLDLYCDQYGLLGLTTAAADFQKVYRLEISQ
jgi:hypothetical protein